MASPLAFIITHANLAHCLLKVSEHLTGLSDHFHVYSNEQLDLALIESEVVQLIGKKNPEQIIIFSDLAGGSCWALSMKIKKSFPQTSLISGTNVPMLVSYLMNYQRLAWPELLEKIVDDGRKGMVLK